MEELVSRSNRDGRIGFVKRVHGECCVCVCTKYTQQPGRAREQICRERKRKDTGVINGDGGRGGQWPVYKYTEQPVRQMAGINQSILMLKRGMTGQLGITPGGLMQLAGDGCAFLPKTMEREKKKNRHEKQSQWLYKQYGVVSRKERTS